MCWQRWQGREIAAFFHERMALNIVQSVRSSASRTRYRLSQALKRPRREDLAYQIDHLLSAWVSSGDTLVVAGFWRSGTTWLQESLAKLIKGKTMFEPLACAIDNAIPYYSEIATKDLPFRRRYMPYCGDDRLSDDGLRRFFDQILRADVRGQATRVLRNRVTESFRLRIVAKFVRIQLCLRAVQNTFSVPVIYVYRDPRAIIASIKMTKWNYLFDDLSLREHLIEPGDGRASYFSNWQDEILKYDKQHRFVRIAAYWALIERFVKHCYENRQARIAFVSYEELCRKRETMLLEILDGLGLGHFVQGNVNALGEDSFSTSEKRRGASVDQRTTGWQKELSGSEVRMIESVVQHFDLADRLLDR